MLSMSLCVLTSKNNKCWWTSQYIFCQKETRAIRFVFLCFAYIFTNISNYHSNSINFVLLGLNSRLLLVLKGCLLYLEIQRGKVGMATQKYQQELGATTACTLRLAEGCIAPEDDYFHTVQGDAWFGSVRAAAALGRKGSRAVLQVKNNKGLFPKDYIEKALEDAPRGMHIVLSGTAPSGINLIALGLIFNQSNSFFHCYS
jgi:hypothetical protein